MKLIKLVKNILLGGHLFIRMLPYKDQNSNSNPNNLYKGNLPASQYGE